MKPTNVRGRVYKTLGTSVILIPLSPPSLGPSLKSISLIYYLTIQQLLPQKTLAVHFQFSCSFRMRGVWVCHHFHTCTPLSSREGGHIRLFITLVPKVYNNVFLFVGVTTWNFDWSIHYVEYPNVSTTKCDL